MEDANLPDFIEESVNPFMNRSERSMSGYPNNYGGGNPANSGFSPGASISTGAGQIVDMILNLLLSGITKKMGGLAHMGRPEVSDNSQRLMRERDDTASRMMSGIYGSSPQNKMFGPLGDNALSQQFGDSMFQSGGSRGDAFKQIFGRFGTQLGGMGSDGMEVAGKASAQVLRNIDSKFTNSDGIWQYGKTAGFNRQNTISAVAEFTSTFGGKEVIDSLSKTPELPESPEEKKNSIEERKRITTEIEKLVKEGNTGSEIEQIIKSREAGKGGEPERQRVIAEVEKAVKEGKSGDEIKKIVQEGKAGKVGGPESPEEKKNSIEERKRITTEIEKLVKEGNTGSEIEQIIKSREAGKGGEPERQRVIAEVEKAVKEGKSGDEIKKIVQEGKAGSPEGEQDKTQGEIDKAAEEVKAITEAVREAGNFFGPNMPFGQLMNEIKTLTDGAKGVTAGSIKDSMQKVQAMAQTVDMGNEAFANYMKVIAEINQNSGGKANTVDMAIESMAVGKAREDLGREKARAKGEVYTGPSKEEEAMNVAKAVNDRNTSKNVIDSKIIVSALANDTSEEAQKITELAASGKAEEAIAMYDELSKQGKFEDKKVWIAKDREQNARGELEWSDAREERARDTFSKRGVRDQYDKSQVEIGVSSKSSVDALTDDFYSNQSNVDQIGGQENVEKVRKGLSGGEWIKSESDLLDTDSLVEKMKKEGLTEEQARFAAESAQRTLYRGLGDSLEPMLKALDPEEEKKRVENIQEAERQKKNMQDATGKNYVEYSDAGALEKGAITAGQVYEDLKAKGKDVKFEDFKEAVMTRGAENFSADPDVAAKEIERAFQWQQRAGKLDAAKKKIYKDKGITEETPEDDPRRIEADKKAHKEVFGEDTIDGQFNKRMETREKEIEKKLEKSGLKKDSDEYVELKDKMMKEASTEEMDAIMGKPSKEKEQENKEKQDKESRKDEGEKDDATSELIAAMNANASKLEALITTIGSWSKALQENIKDRAPGD